MVVAVVDIFTYPEPAPLGVFLLDAEVLDMTGLRQPAAQVRWLKRNNVSHFVRADGRPRVLSYNLWHERQGGPAGQPAKLPEGPDLESVRVKR